MPRQAKASELAAQRVLVADEQLQSTKFVVELCRSFGIADIAAVHSADHVISRLDHASWNILICTWSGGLDAPRLTQRLRATNTKPYQRIRVIVLRAGATGADVGAARDSGADEFVALPLSQGSLLAALRRVSSTDQHFVDCAAYKGPCRRRRRAQWDNERRRIETGETATAGTTNDDPRLAQKVPGRPEHDGE